MAHQIKAFPAKPDDLDLHARRREPNTYKLSLISIYTRWYPIHTYIHT